MLPLLLHIGFAFTGVGTVLLGSILPRVSAQWHLQDKDAGLLLLAQFACSASGALLARENLWRTIAIGYALCGAGGAAICLLQRGSFSFVLVAFGLFGLGLGLAMTSTNLLIGRQQTARRGAALALLNCFWSIGAVVCPLVIAHLPSQTGTGAIFGVTGLLLSPFALLPLGARRSEFGASAATEPPMRSAPEAPTILYFASLAFLYVGVEAAVGNWISTYATRMTTWNLARSSMAVAAFWAALLFGRGFTPLALRVLSERRLYRMSVLMVAGGIVWLLLAHSEQSILGATALTGLALAPIFPLTIALCLAEVGRSNNAGCVLAVAGLGGAVFSWLTGLVSTSSASLRVGLLIPGSAALFMLALISWRPPRGAQALLEVNLPALETGTQG